MFYRTQQEAHNAAVEMLNDPVIKAKKLQVLGWAICKRSGGDFVTWPIVPMSIAPKSYKVLETVKNASDRDHYKALCEELKGALHGIYGEIAGIDAEDRTKAESNIVRRYLAVASGALKKAQKD
jgi:hypothetical protein